MLSGISRCCRLLLYIFCPRLGISYLAKKPGVSHVFYPPPRLKGSPATFCCSGLMVFAKMGTLFLVCWSLDTSSPNCPGSRYWDLQNVFLCSLARKCPLGASTSDPAEPGVEGPGSTVSLSGSLEVTETVAVPASRFWDLCVPP